MYTDDKNVQVVLSLLKAYGIKKVVISPGTTNVPLTRSMESDPFFELYSVVDERSAAYFACGLSFAASEPVVITCTGATASRNYLPGLTEAFYRNLPVIAITCRHQVIDYDDLFPQVIDRTVTPNDVKRFAASLPVVKDNSDLRQCIYLVNKALSAGTVQGKGPVIIDVPTSSNYSFTTKKLPFFTKWEFYSRESMDCNTLAKELSETNVAIFIGAHDPFSKHLEDAIGSFAAKYSAPVICDHTSNYGGRNKVSSSVLSDLAQSKSTPDLVIDIGSVCGDYSATRFFKNVAAWRVSSDGVAHNRQGVERLQKIFVMTEDLFFSSLAQVPFSSCNRYCQKLLSEMPSVRTPVIPFSNTYVCSRVSKLIPKGSFLHLSILNSLRNMNFFDLDPSVVVSSNVGGFGIDGPVSTAIGQSMADKSRLSFCVVGDLAFFYDMNALGIRDIDANLRIILINNGEGVEFRLNKALERQWGSDTDDFIAARGHFGSARAWAESMGFAYLSASTKNDFDDTIKEFMSADIAAFSGRPVLFEAFTQVVDEQRALDNFRDYNRPVRQKVRQSKARRLAKKMPKSLKHVAKRVMR